MAPRPPQLLIPFPSLIPAEEWAAGGDRRRTRTTQTEVSILDFPSCLAPEQDNTGMRGSREGPAPAQLKKAAVRAPTVI